MAQATSGRRARRGSSEHTDALVAWANPKPENGTLLYLDREKIRANVQNPREYFDGPELEGLAQSIRAHGILKPLTVRYEPGLLGTQYELIDGERRWRAAKKAGLDSLPVIVRDVDSKLEQLVMSLVANVQSAPLSTLEESEALGEIQQALGLTTSGLIELVGKGVDAGFSEEAGGKGWIENRLAVYNAPASLKAVLADRPDAMSSVITVSRRIKSPELIERCAVRIRQGATLNDIKALVNELAPLQRKPKADTKASAQPVETRQGAGWANGGVSRSEPEQPAAAADADSTEGLFPVPPAPKEEAAPVLVGDIELTKPNATFVADMQAIGRDRHDRLQGVETVVTVAPPAPEEHVIELMQRIRRLKAENASADAVGALWDEAHAIVKEQR